MTTISQLRKSVNIDELKNDFGTAFNEAQLMNIGLISMLELMIEDVSEEITYSNNNIKNMEDYTFFNITSDGLMDTLRQLYVNTNNGFVKDVVKTVGQTKKFNERQLSIIVKEMIKFNLNINF